MGSGSQPLDIDKLLALLHPGGAVSRTVKGYETRDEQMEMLRRVAEAYNKSNIALIEAGTGTGKSLAYLLPAILWASINKERTVISTGTINLQEQLVSKDIPLLLKILGVDVKTVLVKGMGNYLCRRKLDDARQELGLLNTDDQQQIRAVDDWAEGAASGCRSELPFVVAPRIWDKVRAEGDMCDHQRCPHYKECFFFKAREKTEDAQILVVNHHLLFADLTMRGDLDNKESKGVLPDYKHVVIDEAHHIEAIATEYFATRVNRISVQQALAKLSSDRGTKDDTSTTGKGRLVVLKEKVLKNYGTEPDASVASIHRRLTIELPAERVTLLALIAEFFNALAEYTEAIGGANGQESKEKKLRLLPHHYTHPQWLDEVQNSAKSLLEALNAYLQGITNLLADLSNVNDEKFLLFTHGLRIDIQAFVNRLSEAATVLRTIVFGELDPNSVRWIETRQLKALTNVHLVNASLDISQLLANFLFGKFPTVILCSATLTTNQQFDFIKQRLGLNKTLLPERTITEHIYTSPFDFKEQALLAIPQDMPPPNDKNFLDHACEKIWDAIQASRGNAFVLFTSYSMLQQAYDKLEERLLRHRYLALKQGDDTRQRLLQRFKTTEYSVLFGTDSFWEGVDVQGEALRCVIIVKLPFQVPSEPIVEARTEAILHRGGNPFMEYAVPNAIVKFKQGVGRLIRHKRDRGCVVCLDPRLITKRYGQQFLNSLPPCPRITDGPSIKKEMDAFYRRTYRRVKEAAEAL